MPETEEERKAREAKEQQQGWFNNFLDSINPFSGKGGGFSIGGIFEALLVGVAGYLALRSETVQGWIGGFLDEKDEHGNKKSGTGADKIKGWVGSGGIGETLLGWAQSLGLGGILDKVGLNPDITEQILNATPEQVEKQLTDMEVSPTLKEVLKKNYKTLAPLAVAANGGHVKATEAKTLFTNDKTIFALITQNPSLAKEIVSATLKDNKDTPTDKTAEMQKTMLQSIRAIAADKERFKTLFSNTNRTNTIELMAALGYTMNMDPQTFEKSVITPSMATDEKFENLRILFLSELDKKAGTPSTTTTTAPQTQDQSSTTVTPPAEPTLSIDVQANLAEEGLIKGLGTKNTKSIQDLRKALGDEKFTNLVIALNSTEITNAQKLNFCLQPDCQGALKVFLNKLDISTLNANEKTEFTNLKTAVNGSKEFQAAVTTFAEKGIDLSFMEEHFAVPKDQKATITLRLWQIMHPDFQQAIKTPEGLDGMLVLMKSKVDSEMQPLITKNNLQAIQKFTNTKLKGGGHIELNGAATVVGSMLELANGNSEPMKKNAQLIANFFTSNQCAGAFQTMLKELKIPGKERLLGALVNEWGNRNDGLLEVFSNPDAVKLLPELIQKDGKDMSFWEGIKAAFSSGVLVENQQHLRAVAEAYKNPNGPIYMPKKAAPVVSTIAH